jgi:tRNA(fMet)-specific endonuclease VapC
LKYLPDTNACVAYLRGQSSKIIARFAACPFEDIVLCDIVKAELYYGAFKSARTEINIIQIETFFAPFASIPFDTNAAAVFGRIRRELEAVGTPIGPYDLLIAAIALANNLTLVTHNTREFGRMTALKVDDWEI